MPSPQEYLGATYDIYVPDPDRLIDLGYTGIRVYWAASEAGSYSLATTLTLVAGQHDYSYNKTDGLWSDWARHAYYGATPGEGTASEAVPVGPPRYTRKEVRQGVGKRLRLMEALTRTGTASATAHTFTALVDADGSTYKYCNWFLRTVSGATTETRRVRNKTNSGYAPATGIITTNAFSATIEAAVECELWQPRGDEDISAMVDEAMNDARHRVCWESSHYLSTDSGVSEYFLPAGINGRTILDVDWATDTYPDKPGWEPVPYWKVSPEGSGFLLTVLGHGLGHELLAADTVIRVRYLHYADRMDNDSDSWDVPLEFAVAETALSLLDRIGLPVGPEQASDAQRAKAEIARDLDTLRAFLPQPKVNVRVAR